MSTLQPDIAAATPPHAHEPQKPEPAPFRERLITLSAVVVPFLGLLSAIYLLWGVGFGWLYLILLVSGYLLTAFGVTVGYHRLFTHKSFRTNRVVTAILGILGSMAVEGPLLRWVATHRKHHQHSDCEHDPHSPHAYGHSVVGFLRGAAHAHLGWFFEKPPADLDRYIPDLKSDRLLRAISALFPLWVVLGLAIPTLVGWAMTGTWTGALLGLLWGGLVRVLIVHHVTWSINSVCHLWGARPYNTHDHSRNNLLFGLIGMGEGWHNNHHAFPDSARHGLRWWQLDISYLLIRSLAAVHLASDIRLPSRERLSRRER